MKRNGWYNDPRTNKKFTMLSKRIEVEGKWYRALVRFTYDGLTNGTREMYTLSLPCPFIITQCEPVVSISSARWKDNKVYHGPTIGIAGYLQQKVPSSIIEEVQRDLKEHTKYN
jgi:hypothetical protein